VPKSGFIALLAVVAAVLVYFAASPAIGLAAGIAIGLTLGNPVAGQLRKFAKHALTVAVCGLGGDVPLRLVLDAGKSGIVYTAIGITLTLIVGALLAKLLAVPGRTGFLVSAGTAICGGSAIAAVAPVIEAEEQEISVALATVFILNGVALFIFPPIGHAVGLDENQFGLWAALGIHDTSSVVGAAMSYGPTATMIATAVKLARALWIVPLTLLAAYIHRRATHTEGPKARPPLPIAVIGFLTIAVVIALVPALQPTGHIVAVAAKRLMTVTLLAIGVSLTRKTLAQVGARPLIHGVVLWLLVGSISLAAIRWL
jgi:uncharacterized integral membrane protein (TIGR00698 family)